MAELSSLEIDKKIASLNLPSVKGYEPDWTKLFVAVMNKYRDERQAAQIISLYKRYGIKVLKPIALGNLQYVSSLLENPNADLGRLEYYENYDIPDILNSLAGLR